MSSSRPGSFPDRLLTTWEVAALPRVRSGNCRPYRNPFSGARFPVIMPKRTAGLESATLAWEANQTAATLDDG
jgi:hypothetical protein